MAMLTQSVREQSRAVGTSPSADFRLERSADAYSQRHRTGATGTFRFGGFLVQAFPPDAKTSATPLRAVCREALAILRLNRLAGEIATYQVPGFNRAYHGLTYLPEFNPGVTRATEGVFISYRTGRDILAHEIGHLLMRAGHCTFEGPNGLAEGSAPAGNLMHRDNESRAGTDLTAGQVERMRREGRSYLHA